jgi:hypothetical protein
LAAVKWKKDGRDAILAQMSVLYILLLTPGVGLCLFSFSRYPAVDRRVPMGIMLGTFLFPFVLYLLSLVLNRQSGNLKLWRVVYSLCAAGLVVVSVFWLMNGALDKSPTTQITASLRSKTVIRGRGRQYHLVLTSWVPGHTEEHFDVTPDVFDRCIVGQNVTLAVHPGFFGVPWHGAISPN